MSKSIREKIFDITNRIPGIKKDGLNEEEGFEYSTANIIKEVIVPQMALERILMQPEIVERSTEIVNHPTLQIPMFFTKFQMVGKFYDLDSPDADPYVVPSEGHGYSNNAWTPGEAMTNGIKYIYIQTFNLKSKDDTESGFNLPNIGLSAQKPDKSIFFNKFKNLLDAKTKFLHETNEDVALGPDYFDDVYNQIVSDSSVFEKGEIETLHKIYLVKKDKASMQTQKDQALPLSGTVNENTSKIPDQDTSEADNDKQDQDKTDTPQDVTPPCIDPAPSREDLIESCLTIKTNHPEVYKKVGSGMNIQNVKYLKKIDKLKSFLKALNEESIEV